MTGKWALGLDLSLASTGWATWGAHPAAPGIQVGTIPTTNADHIGHRLNHILINVLARIEDDPAVVVIEYLPDNPRFQGSNLGRVHAVLEHHLWLRVHQYGIGCPRIVNLPATSLKKFATGKGTSGKPAMQQAAAERLGFFGHQDDEIDALWLAVAGAHLAELPSAPTLPKAQLAALTASKDVTP